MARFLSATVSQWLLSGIGLLATGCTDPYLPEVQQSPPSYLVVDGYLNAQGITTIKLSRTYAVGAKTAPPAEAKATVYMEDEAGTRIVLQEAPAGTYASPSQNLNPARRYRLHLTTLGGKDYASDFVPVKLTPPIDAVSWQADNAGLHIAVDTHDASGNTRYYRWEGIETWEIYPVYQPVVEFVNGQMRDIVVPFPSVCYGTANTTAIRVSNTTALSQDVVARFPVQQLPAGSDRLFSRYSLLVQQHALTKQEYAYWELLRKNTESIGSLFDPQPVQLTGNVHGLSNPAETVLGYVGAHSVSEKRVFIARADLPRNWPVRSGYEDCLPPDTVTFGNPPSRFPNEILRSYFGSPNFLPIDPIFDKAGGLRGYTGKSRACIDCRLRGSATKPSFW
jgi:hypothetical protein